MVVLAMIRCSLHFNKSQTDSQYILLVCGVHGSLERQPSHLLSGLQPLCCTGVITHDGILPSALMLVIIELPFQLLPSHLPCLQSLQDPSIAHKCLLTTTYVLQSSRTGRNGIGGY